jgi:dTMP kinase
MARLYAFPTYDKEPASPVGPVIADHLKGRWWVQTGDGADYGSLAEAALGWKDDKRDPLVFQCCMSADKYACAPAIRALSDYGGTVVLDRWWQSAYVYGGADGLDLSWLLTVHKSLPQPDVNILLDVDFETSLARRPDRRDRYETMGKAFFDDLRHRYLTLWRETAREKKLPGRWIVIDGRQSAEEVKRTIDEYIPTP